MQINIIYSKVFDITIIKIDNKKFKLNRMNNIKSFINNSENKELIIKELKVYYKYNKENKTIEKLLKDI